MTRHLLTRTTERTVLGGPTPEWLYANASEAGFFRVDHGREGFERLLRALPHLSALERVGWIGHQWALVGAGRARITSALDLVGALGDEQDPDVLAAAERVLANLLRRLAPACGSEVEDQLRVWIADRFEGQFADVGLEGSKREGLTRRRRRTRILSIVGGLAHSETVLEACAGRARDHLNKGKALPIGIGDEILRIATSTGDSAMQTALLAAVREATTPQGRRRSLFALAGFDRGPGLRETLRATLDPTLAPAVDRATLLMLLLSSPRSAGDSWKHLQKVWTRLEKQMPPILLARIVATTGNALPLDQAPRIRAFFAEHPLAAGSRVLSQVAEEFEIANRLKAHAGKDLIQFLDRRESGKDTRANLPSGE